MASHNQMKCGDFRTSYEKDSTIFPTPFSRKMVLASIAVLLILPMFADSYMLNLSIQIGYYAVAALGLNILVGFTGQISLGHAAFFGFGAFASAWINNSTGIPVFFTIPLAGLLTMAVGLIFGVPAGRIKGLYLAIATLASQYILEDFFGRAGWFTGGPYGAMANPVSVFGFEFDSDQSFFYIVLFWLVLSYVLGANLMRSRDGRALVAVRDHYLSAEIMGINLTKYRIMSFGLSALFAGIGGALFGHYLGFISAEGFNILLSIQFLAMIIIGGLGSVMGSLMGVIFMVLLPEVMEFAAGGLRDIFPSLAQSMTYLKQMSIGIAIILFLIFEPDGLAHRWRMTKAYWKLYPFSY